MTGVATELAEMRKQVDAMAARIGLRPRYLPTFGEPDQTARPAVLYDGSWHYVSAERGREHSRVTTDQARELLFLVFHDATGKAARDDELAHREPGRDSRRVWLERQVELLTRLDKEWGERQRREFDRLLARHPYDDRRSGNKGGEPRRTRPAILLPSLAAAFNILAAAGCVALAIVAPSRAAVLLAIAGIVFFGLAALGFALMLRLHGAGSPRAR